MNATAYATGVVTMCALIVSLGVGAVALRRRWLGGWVGAPARLAEAVIALGATLLLCEGLGTVGAFGRVAVVLGAFAVGALMVIVGRRSATSTSFRPAHPAQPAWAIPFAGLVTAVVFTQWIGYVREALRTGITNVDSLHYHLPFAARFAQTGDVSKLNFLWLDPVWSFYPNNAELLHALGMVGFGRDVLSPFMNLLWLAIGLLAGWVLGRPFGVGHLTLALVAVVFASPLTASLQSGSAMNDAAALALFLAALALIAQADQSWAGHAIAGLAAGLAVGTKVTTIVPLLAVALLVVGLAGRGRRLATALAWAGSAAAGGAYWFLRDLVRTGSPMPAIAIPGLPSPRLPAVEAYGRSVADYLGDRRFWRVVVPSGFREVFGPAYPFVLGLAALGLVLGLASCIRGRTPAKGQGIGAPGTPGLRTITAALVVAALASASSYVVTPVTAYGPPGNPYLFGANLRYAFPALLAALVLLALVSARARRQWGVTLAALAAVLLLAELGHDPPGHEAPLVAWRWWFVVVALLWLLGTSAARGVDQRQGKLALVAVTGSALLLAGIGGYRLANSYLDRRYISNPVWAWSRNLHDARIAVVGYPAQYPLTGLDLSNRVAYVGRSGRGGAFESYRRCVEFRTALRSGHYDFLVAGPEKWGLESAPERGWERDDPAATPIIETAPKGRPAATTTVFRLDRGPVDSARC